VNSEKQQTLFEKVFDNLGTSKYEGVTKLLLVRAIIAGYPWIFERKAHPYVSSRTFKGKKEVWWG
jgi:hypothetical protein